MTESDFTQACLLYWEFELATSGVDFSNLISLDDGRVMTRVEHVMNWHLGCSRKIQLAFDGEKAIGIMIYHQEVAPLMFVRSMYVLPEYRGFKVAKKLLTSIPNQPAKVLFQTMTKNPHKEIFGHTPNRELLHEDLNYKTWMMDFKGDC